MPVAALSSIISDCKTNIEDLQLNFIKEIKKKNKNFKVAGYFPVYVPEEILIAAGFLPIAIMGAGNLVEVEYADSRVQSFICSISRTTLELGLRGYLKDVDVLIFPSICDVARNLSGVWKRNFPEQKAEFFHFPQRMDSSIAVDYLESEYNSFYERLCDISGIKPDKNCIHDAISVMNENRRLLEELYVLRSNDPDKLSSKELFILERASSITDRKSANEMLKKAIYGIKERPSIKRDRVRVIVEGLFCEQPPMELIDVLEESGCAIVGDDAIMGSRWFGEDIDGNGDPIRALARAYIEQSRYSSVRHYGSKPRNDALIAKVKECSAEGVIFCTTKFCDIALFDYVTFKTALENEGIPYLSFEFEEKMTVFETMRTQIETFVESILFFP